MLDYKTELGGFLTNALKKIQKSDSPLTRDEFARCANIETRMATDVLESLYNRGFIMDTVGVWKNDGEKFFSTKAKWVISADGINYLENHHAWWKRFWMRSVICPLIVAFVVSFFTALVAPSAWNFIKELPQKIQSEKQLPPP